MGRRERPPVITSSRPPSARLSARLSKSFLLFGCPLCSAAQSAATRQAALGLPRFVQSATDTVRTMPCNPAATPIPTASHYPRKVNRIQSSHHTLLTRVPHSQLPIHQITRQLHGHKYKMSHHHISCRINSALTKTALDLNQCCQCLPCRRFLLPVTGARARMPCSKVTRTWDHTASPPPPPPPLKPPLRLQPATLSSLPEQGTIHYLEHFSRT